MHTVGLIGANGLLGGPTAKLLAQSAKEGKVKLVLLHRAGSPPKATDLHDNIELRIVDLNGPPSQLEQAVKGINVFISAVGIGALPLEPNLVDALAKSADLVTYIPSTYSTTWNEKDATDPQLGPILKFLHSGWDRAKERGIGITAVYIGCFEKYFFEIGFVGCVLKQNLVWANEKQLQNRFPITTIDHISKGLAGLALSDPQSIKNTEHSFVTYWQTGNEVVELYTRINGKPAEVRDFTQKDAEEISGDAANLGAARVGYWDHWEKGDWEYESRGKVYHDKYEGPTLEEVTRRFA